MSGLPPLLPWPAILQRLQTIFPEGTPYRENCVIDRAAQSVFVLLYIGAIEGEDVWLRPDQVTRMTDAQAKQTAEASRLAWLKESLKGTKKPIPGRWFAHGSRESIRDDTFRNGLATNGALVEKSDVPTNSPAGRHALELAFSNLFEPALSSSELTAAIHAWQSTHLTQEARLRITVMREGAIAAENDVSVTYSGGTRILSAGLSSYLIKATIEQFAPRYLHKPAVLLMSDTKHKVIARDDALLKKIGLTLKAEKTLPDIILADIGAVTPKLVFIEIVATAGPVDETRKAIIQDMVQSGGYDKSLTTFVTVYLDRAHEAFKKTVSAVSWGSYVWFAAEPENLVQLIDGKTTPALKI